MRRIVLSSVGLAVASTLVVPEAVAAQTDPHSSPNSNGSAGTPMRYDGPENAPMWKPETPRRVPATGGVARRGSIVVKDAAGDGKADLVSLRVWHKARIRIPVVNVRVRGVRHLRRHFLLIYVDPYGVRRRPSYAFVVELNRARRYAMYRTRGWALGRQLGTCGESGKSGKPASGVRIIRFQMPMACFGNYGARFATSTLRFTRSGKLLGDRDWAPGKRRLTRTFRF